MSGDKPKDIDIAIFTWKEYGKVMGRVVGSGKSDNLGGSIGKNIYATALDVANSGLVGSEAKTVAGLLGSLSGKAKSEGDKILENLQELKKMQQIIIDLNKQVLQQLTVIESKLDQVTELVQWTYALGNTHPYATFLEQAIEHWTSAAKFDTEDGSLSPEQKKLATDFTSVTAGGLENQLQLFYEGVIGKNITGSGDLGLMQLYLKQSWERIAQNNFQMWFNNASTFIGKVKTLLLQGIHVMMWAVGETSPADTERYKTKYSGWLKAVDDQLLTLIPTVLHQLFVQDTNYNLAIKPAPIQGGFNQRYPFSVTDSFQSGGATLQRIAFPTEDINAAGNSTGQWQAPPAPELYPQFGYGTLHDVKKRSQFNVVWDTAKFTFKILKADIGKLSATEPAMYMGTMSTTYTISAHRGPYSFTQDDAVLTTGNGIEMKLKPLNWDSRNNGFVINTANNQYLATADIHGTGGVFSFDLSFYVPRFTPSPGDNFAFASLWNFTVAQ